MDYEFDEDVLDYLEGLSEDDMESLVRKVMQSEYEKFCDRHRDSQNLVANDLLCYRQFPSMMQDAESGWLKDMANKKEPYTPHELRYLAHKAGKDGNGFSPLDEMDDSEVTDDMLRGYAEHLRNYLYTYKDEARGVDPSIDPTEEHRGPMAQDIEQVAPDCVKETPEGVKTVDGNRLALVNAGVIGELSRRVMELEERLNARNSNMG